jgi:hypothetical protein
VIPLHQLLHLLRRLRGHSLPLHHFLELLHAADFEFGDDRPVTFRAEIRHHPHLAEPELLVDA